MFSNMRANFVCHKYLRIIGEDFCHEGIEKLVAWYNKHPNRPGVYVEK